MIGKEIESEDIVSLVEVKEILENRKKKNLTYEQQLAYDHASKFAANKILKNRILKLGEELGIDKKIVIEIVNTKPKNILALKQILSRNSKPLSDEDENKIMGALKS
ncbi:MAG: hypothetical protein ACP5UN_02630 [Candidatus Micrarchaeia archaeon]